MSENSIERTDQWVERLTALFLEHVDSVFTVAHRILWSRSDAEDVVQTTFVRAGTRMGQLREPHRARPWLLQIAYRESIGVLRKRRDVPTDPSTLPDVASAAPGPEDLAVGADIATRLVAGLARLRADDRTAVVLRDVEGLAMREVADVLDVGLSAAKMRVHRGRKALRVMLSEEVADAL